MFYGIGFSDLSGVFDVTICVIQGKRFLFDFVLAFGHCFLPWALLLMILGNLGTNKKLASNI